MSLLFNMLSRLVITFLPRNKCLLISWLQSPSAVILEPRKIKSDTASIVSPSISHEVMGPDTMILVFWMSQAYLIYFLKRKQKLWVHTDTFIWNLTKLFFLPLWFHVHISFSYTKDLGSKWSYTIYQIVSKYTTNITIQIFPVSERFFAILFIFRIHPLKISSQIILF